MRVSKVLTCKKHCFLCSFERRFFAPLAFSIKENLTCGKAFKKYGKNKKSLLHSNPMQKRRNYYSAVPLFFGQKTLSPTSINASLCNGRTRPRLLGFKSFRPEAPGWLMVQFSLRLTAADGSLCREKALLFPSTLLSVKYILTLLFWFVNRKFFKIWFLSAEKELLKGFKESVFPFLCVLKPTKKRKML